MSTLQAAVLLALGIMATPCETQTLPAPDSIQRLSGTETSSRIIYALISMKGTRIGDPMPAITPPRLTDADGKFRFELLADFGNVSEIAFYPPWKPSPGDLYPPVLTKLQLTMEFLGYTKVKPVKRQWEYLQRPTGELRYSTPGMASANMEPIAFYLQYLRALPTLHLTTPDKRAVEFETAAWQQAIRAEPLCHASGR